MYFWALSWRSLAAAKICTSGCAVSSASIPSGAATTHTRRTLAGWYSFMISTAFVAVQPDVADRHVRQELEHRTDEPEAGPQNRDGHHPVVDFVALHRFEGRLNGEGTRAQIFRRFVEQKRDDLVGGFAEVVGFRVAISQPGQVVRDQGMVDDVEGHLLRTPSLTLPTRGREFLSCGGIP